MFSNYLKIAYRTLLKNKVYSLITILGLAVGVAATILILLYVRFESSYDNFHVNGDNIYRASFASFREGTEEGVSAAFTPPFGPAAKEEIPEVRNYVRLSTPRVSYAAIHGQTVRLENIRHADSTFFEVFSFTLERGNPRRALTLPYSIVLSRKTAGILFGHEDPLGQTIRLNGKEDYTVTGVADDPPANSHIRFSALISFSTLEQDPNLFLGWDGGNQYIAYLFLEPHANIAAVQQQCANVMWRHMNQRYASIGIRIEASLQPLSKIHLWFEPESETLRTNLTIFGLIALFILLIACMNFINLSTARAVRRTKEVGVRKALGAARADLIRQFLGEAILVSVISCLLAAAAVEIAIPWYRQFLNLQIPSLQVSESLEVVSFLFLIVIVGVIAGSYPAFYLSRFDPIYTLKTTIQPSHSKSLLRSVLVTFQFAVSIGLIVCTLVVGSQLRFMLSRELGFHKEGMMVISLRGEAAQDRVGVLRQELLRIQGVAGVSASSEVPSAGFTSNGYIPEGQKSPMMFHVVDIDDQFISTYGLTLAQGEGFSAEKQSTFSGYVINESLANQMGWKDPVGKHIARDGSHEIIGVVKDFHFASLREAIEPLIMTNKPWRNRFDDLTVRFSSANIPDALRAIRETWNRVVPGSPFEYSFLDDRLNSLYGPERSFQDLFLSFSALAVVIALSGLLGLASFAAEQRTKEIGVRKVMGASALSVIRLLSREYVRVILIANLVAWPVAYFSMSRWLQDYAYQVGLGWWIFVLSGAAVLVLGLSVVTTQALKAASTNPVDALRYE